MRYLGVISTGPDIFAFRLRLHRERHGLSIADVASLTRIKPEFLEALERNEMANWPHGLYARSWIGAYAKAVGLDPDDTVEEFCRLFPHGDRRRRDTLREMAAIVGHVSEYRDEFRETDRRRGTPHTDRPSVPTMRSVIARTAELLWARLATLVPSS